MADNKDKQEEIKVPERRVMSQQEARNFDWSKERRTEKKEVSPDDKIVSAELRREIEMMELDENTKAQAEKKAKKIEFLGEKEKIEHLLKIAREKGLIFAVGVAKKMNDPYLLDILHDILAQEGYYQKIGQGNSDDSQT